LVIALGGTDREVAEAIRAEGFDAPPLRTIEGWRLRDSVPGRWAPLLIEIAMRRGLLKKVSHLRGTP
jgi:hypothetical protein